MGREISAAQYYKYKIAKDLAEVLVKEFAANSDDGTLDYFLNSVVNSCNACDISSSAMLAEIHNNLAGRILGPQTPEEFELIYNGVDVTALI